MDKSHAGFTAKVMIWEALCVLIGYYKIKNAGSQSEEDSQNLENKICNAIGVLSGFEKIGVTFDPGNPSEVRQWHILRDIIINAQVEFGIVEKISEIADSHFIR